VPAWPTAAAGAVPYATVRGPSLGHNPTAEALLAAFFDATNQAMFTCAADGTIVSSNRGAGRIFGRAADDLIGETLLSLFPQHLRSDVEQLREAASGGERVERAVVEIEREDGMTLPIALSIAAVAGSDGHISRYAVVADELTETRLAQAALAEVEARFAEWEALAHVGRWLWDLGTDSVQWSDELHRMHGVAPSDFEGDLEAHLACLHPDDRARIRTRMERAAESGHSFDDAYRVVLPNGETPRFDVRAEVALNSSGAVVGLRGMSRRRTQMSATAREQPHPVEQV
jgi:PAS domain S-box-containing protein